MNQQCRFNRTITLSILHYCAIFLLLPTHSSGFYNRFPICKTAARPSHQKFFQQNLDSSLDDENDVWATRRKIIRTVATPIVKNIKSNTKSTISSPTSKDNADKFQFILTASLVTIGVLVFRFGGRLAFMNFLGLSFITEAGINAQMNQFVTYFQSFHGLQLIPFLFSWIVVKALCIDALTVVLALSSGVLFGGLWQGTLASVGCAMTASLLCFYLSRNLFREKAREEIEKRPVFRAVDRACSKEGFKTVFTLRLSPVLPIPVAGYSYLYGATSLSAIDFTLGTTLGSIKPYALDCYLGLVGKGILDEADGLQQPVATNDVVLFIAFVVLLVVGSLATQVASRTWEEMQSEFQTIENLPNMLGGEESVNQKIQKMGWKEMWGVKDSDLPEWAQSIGNDIGAAWQRVEVVLLDELRVLTAEISTEKNNPAINNGSAMMNILETKRNTQDYELEKPNVDNLGRYTQESLVFSFVLFNIFGKLFGGELPEST